MKKIILKYPAIFEVVSDGISISFPDIPEAITCAFSKKQGYKMAKEVLELVLHGTNVNELPTQCYPVKRFTSKSLYIRTMTVKLEIKENCLFGKNVVEFSKEEAEAYMEQLIRGDSSEEAY